jgi:hypothetical protein
MPSSQLKRAERAIQAIRDQGELPPETAKALTELVDAVRYIEDRLSALKRKGRPHLTEAMALTNQKWRPSKRERPQPDEPRPSKFGFTVPIGDRHGSLNRKPGDCSDSRGHIATGTTGDIIRIVAPTPSAASSPRRDPLDDPHRAGFI